MKNVLTTMNIRPRPLSLGTCADFVWLHWFEKKAEKKEFPAGVNFLEKSKSKGIKIIWNVHNKIPHGTTNLDRVKKFMKLLADTSYRIVIHSKITIQMIEELCENEEAVLKKTVWVPHPHYIGVYGPQKTDICLDSNKLKLCFFGAVKQYKNVELLISAVTELGFEDIELNIYGRCRPPKYAQSLRHLAAGNRNIKTCFKFVRDRDIPGILAGSHLLVLPYNLDSSLNSGATILAFSYGRTVLSPTTGTLSDIEDKSLFFAYSYNNQAQHKEELKKQITAIREKYRGSYNELLKLGERCREYVAENNSLAQVAKRLEQVFNVDEENGRR
jgi:glycosyltransferase involved in cell wall biosynthesis